MPGMPLDTASMVRRAALELFSGAVVALGPGIPCNLPKELPGNNGVWFLADSGALGIESSGENTGAVDSGGNTVSLLSGGAWTGVVDIAGIFRGGHTDIAILDFVFEGVNLS
jgi:acyl CoA:acetate/3-ketoacid CoA transferase beta subunit